MAPVLRGENWSLPFHISTDASDTALGGVLGQKENQQNYAIYFTSKNLTPPRIELHSHRKRIFSRSSFH
jgi:hypothetical protein